MARKSTPTQQTRKSTQGRKAAPSGSSGRRRPAQRAQEEARVFDERTRRDIAGVLFIVAAVVLLVAAVLPAGDAIVASFLSEALRLTFGVGAYVMPLFLAAIGVTFLVRFERERVSVRAAIGLALILVALLGLIALATPIAPGAYDQLFLRQLLLSHGGYIGAGIAWAGYLLFGPVITGVILVGLIIVGVIVIGFSVSKLIETVRRKRAEREAELASAEAPPFARIRRARRRDSAPVDELPDDAAPSAVTRVLGTNGMAAADEGVDPSARTVSLLSAERSHRRHSRRFEDDAEPAAPAPTRPLAAVPEVAPPDEEAAFEPPATITRKLGDRRGRAADASPAPAADGPVESAAPKPKRPSRAKAKPAPEPPAEGGFRLPPLDLLVQGDGKTAGASDSELEETAANLQETLEDFGIMVNVVGWVAGPTVTLFKVELPPGVRVSRITALNDDIALALAAPGVRIFAPVPGTNYVGIEVPNRARKTVYLTDVLKDVGEGPMQICIGKDVEGHSITGDLSKMPHLLIAGTTGSGKSVEINAMIMTILMRATPDEVRFIMIDPKRVEFSGYNGIPHLYVPVVTECKEASSALSWGVAEMERRLKLFSKVGARNIGSFNAKAKAAKEADEAARAAGQEPEPNEFGDPLPFIVIVIDELADLMMNVGKEVEFSISRIAQLARAAGIHLIIATQRPSTNVVTGLIKANITCRIGLTVASGIDSRVILDSTGAENLCGYGDLLISKPEYAKPLRVQGPYVSDEEINAVVEHLKAQGEPEYHSEILQTNVVTLGASSPSGDGGSEADDPLLWEAAEIVVSSGLGSTSNIQRRLKVGYARAGRIMDQLEEKGVVGPANGSKPRDVLVDEMELETLKAFEASDED
ncbi:MAG: DNA translocase FtsK [Eggerthellaceae bacterium]|nr:DNA translocase FtsK [Eggerthellaceae bacterium]